MWAAIRGLAPTTGSHADAETLEADTPYNGPFPDLFLYDRLEDVGAQLARWLTASAEAESRSIGATAVLCPTNRVARRVERILTPHIRTAPTDGSGFDPDAPGVKILTMHSAKGLEFPVVAVVGVEDRHLPWPAPSESDADDHQAQQQRVLFVACSRAARRLAVFASQRTPSVFLPLFSDDHWERHVIAG